MSKKKDADSWRYGGIKRRDFRHAHDEPEVPRHQGKKKNTKKFCKGKQGVEHVSVRRAKTYKNSKGETKTMYHYIECENCKKRLRFDWSF